jgi:hypothetical protein
MSNRSDYRWIVERYDDCGVAVETTIAADAATSAIVAMLDAGLRGVKPASIFALALRRETGRRGSPKACFAYSVAGKLEAKFDDGSRTPKRYRDELRAAWVTVGEWTEKHRSAEARQ